MRQTMVMKHFLARLAPPLAASFSDEQLAAVEMHFAMRHRAEHLIDWRGRIGLPFMRKLYLVVLAGHDRRRR